MSRKLWVSIWLLCAAVASGAGLQQGPPLPHQLVAEWAKLPHGWNFGECTGVDVDENDNVWVFHRGPHAVMQFTPQGQLIQAWENVPVVSAHGLRIGPDGHVWLVDVGGHRILKCDRSGKIKMVIAMAGGAAGDQDSKYGFNRPAGLRFAPNGDFFVADGYGNSRVVRYSKDGVYKNHWGAKGTGDGQFNLVHDVTVDAKGRVYVGDRTNARVQLFDAEGKFLGKWTDVGSPWGLCYVEKENAIYMADGANNRIVKLNLDGQVLGVLSEFGKAPGKLDFAHNIAVDSTGAIYVVEIVNWRIQKFAVR